MEEKKAIETGWAIEVREVSKTYGQTQALNKVSLEVRKGELFGLIGPDGSGKTSLFRILTTLLLADSGTVRIAGLDVVKHYKELRKIIGYMPGRFSLYPDLSVRENLEFFARVFHTNIRENYDLIRDIYSHIEPFENRRAGKLSGGMKQKLALSCALIHRPTILFLDEPTTGVDPVSRKDFWEILDSLKQMGISILVSTPYMDEAGLCDRIALIQEGKILSVGTPDEITGKFTDKLYRIRSENNFHLLRELEQNPEVKTAFLFGEYLHVVPKTGANLNIPGLEEIDPGIEDCFIELMNKKT